MPVRLYQPGQHIDGSQYFQRPVDRGASDSVTIASGELGDQLFGGKRSHVSEHGVHYHCPGLGETVSVLDEQGLDFRTRDDRCSWLGGRRDRGVHHEADATTRATRWLTCSHALMGNWMARVVVEFDAGRDGIGMRYFEN